MRYRTRKYLYKTLRYFASGIVITLLYIFAAHQKKLPAVFEKYTGSYIRHTTLPFYTQFFPAPSGASESGSFLSFLDFTAREPAYLHAQETLQRTLETLKELPVNRLRKEFVLDVQSDPALLNWLRAPEGKFAPILKFDFLSRMDNRPFIRSFTIQDARGEILHSSAGKNEDLLKLQSSDLALTPAGFSVRILGDNVPLGTVSASWNLAGFPDIPLGGKYSEGTFILVTRRNGALTYTPAMPEELSGLVSRSVSGESRYTGPTAGRIHSYRVISQNYGSLRIAVFFPATNLAYHVFKYLIYLSVIGLAVAVFLGGKSAFAYAREKVIASRANWLEAGLEKAVTMNRRSLELAEQSQRLLVSVRERESNQLEAIGTTLRRLEYRMREARFMPANASQSQATVSSHLDHSLTHDHEHEFQHGSSDISFSKETPRTPDSDEIEEETDHTILEENSGAQDTQNNIILPAGIKPPIVLTNSESSEIVIVNETEPVTDLKSDHGPVKQEIAEQKNSEKKNLEGTSQTTEKPAANSTQVMASQESVVLNHELRLLEDLPSRGLFVHKDPFPDLTPDFSNIAKTDRDSEKLASQNDEDLQVLPAEDTKPEFEEQIVEKPAVIDTAKEEPAFKNQHEKNLVEQRNDLSVDINFMEDEIETYDELEKQMIQTSLPVDDETRENKISNPPSDSAMLTLIEDIEDNSLQFSNEKIIDFESYFSEEDMVIIGLEDDPARHLKEAPVKKAEETISAPEPVTEEKLLFVDDALETVLLEQGMSEIRRLIDDEPSANHIANMSEEPDLQKPVTFKTGFQYSGQSEILEIEDLSNDQSGKKQV